VTHSPAHADFASRVVNMHGPSDNEFVFEYPAGFGSADGMNPQALVETLHPARLIRAASAGAGDSGEFLSAIPHAPNNGHRFRVVRASAARRSARS
jgi:hypothetical protein